ncbi:hypothetical protein WR25_10660 [Diploscapter pachys]|uniref:Glycosyltransferase family 92 protein n=1 Tax=Diploscapter pachys TaxID=2018661 RepID=A0A2A2LLQ4_9BILA|nr:hypothetical protein WR25_10660 [Diploscapter pachys]
MSVICNNGGFKYVVKCFICTIGLVVLYICIEVFVTDGNGPILESISSMKFYGQAEKPKIAIIVVTHRDGTGQYSLALDSIKCYCQARGYEFILIFNDRNEKCGQRDITFQHFFRRHCHVANEIANSTINYFLFIDADIGVVNPKRKIEEFIDPKFDMIYYNRFYNQEITAGSYIAKNTNWTIKYLRDYANYETKLPRGDHGKDNGGLHAYIAEVLFPKRPIEIASCWMVYNQSRNHNDLFTFEACIQTLLGIDEDISGRIKIFKKGTGWCRDSWLTNSLWNSTTDFMIHGWKNSRMINYTEKELPLTIRERDRGRWYNPYAGPLDLSKCTPGNDTWNFDPNIQTTVERIREKLDKYYAQFEMDKINRLSRLSWYFQKKTEPPKKT